MMAREKSKVDRAFWVKVLTRIADPVLTNMSEGSLRKKMRVEFSPTWVDLNAEKGAAFFSGYGKETGTMWNESREEIIAVANETFEKIGKCLVKM